MMRVWLIVAALALVSCQSEPAKTAQEKLFDEAQAAVKAALKDPGSAEFSDLYQCGESRIVTGEVNAKNSFGGYNGKTPFVYALSEVHLQGEADSDVYVKALASCTEAIKTGAPAIPPSK